MLRKLFSGFASRTGSDDAPARLPGARAVGPRGVRLFKDRAERTAGQPGKLSSLAARATAKLAANRVHLSALRDDVPVLIRLIRAYAYGRYREIPWRSLVLIVAGVLYFVSPADLIPDWIVGLGLLDDALVISYVLRAVHEDLAHFVAWEDASQAPSSPPDAA
ncbi:MAG: YkvA family protein [Rubricoccaceae bacterium]